jgi:hypothetical protein
MLSLMGLFEGRRQHTRRRTSGRVLLVGIPPDIDA